MEGFTFDIDSILSPEEADAYLNEDTQKEEVQEGPAQTQTDTQTEEVEEPSEEVGQEEIHETVGDAVTQTGDGSSPNIYSSIANALKEDGIFPDFTDDELNAIKSPEDFGELFEKAISARMDERTRRIDEALGNGVSPDQVKMYEQTLEYLDTVTEDAIKDEGEEGETLRKQLIYNDLINKGYSQERAAREVEKSFKTGDDVDDATDALKELKKFYKTGYDNLRSESKAKADAAREEQRKNAEKFRKMVIDDDVQLGDIKLDKRTKQRVFDAVSKPVYKDPATGQLLTQVQKFQKENPLEFLKQLGMWFVLTDGGKNAGGFAKETARAEKRKGIQELERVINSTQLNSDGSLRYMSGTKMENGDTLLSGDWNIDLGK